MYEAGLGLRRLGHFADHDGFDGEMMGFEDAAYHFEFVHCRNHPIRPHPTEEDLIVLYLPDAEEWTARCGAMVAAGFAEVAPFNPYWAERGRTFRDRDGYRIVLERAAWGRR